MSSINRKLKRRKEKERNKQSKKIMKEVGNAISSMPKLCGSCGIELDKKDTASLNEWRIQIFKTGRINLTCGACSEETEKSD